MVAIDTRGRNAAYGKKPNKVPPNTNGRNDAYAKKPNNVPSNTASAKARP